MKRKGKGLVRLTLRGAAEDINREPLGSLNEYFPHLESSERHLGAAREISEISCGSLQQLLGIFGRPFSESWGSLGDFKAAPGCLLVAFNCLGGENIKILRYKGIKNRPKLEIVHLAET